MLGFERSLEEFKSSEVGWKGACVDCNELKSILQVEDSESLQVQFFCELKLQIEKISLFALKQEGQLADVVGCLKFDLLDALTHVLHQVWICCIFSHSHVST